MYSIFYRSYRPGESALDNGWEKCIPRRASIKLNVSCAGFPSGVRFRHLISTPPPPHFYFTLFVEHINDIAKVHR